MPHVLYDIVMALLVMEGGVYRHLDGIIWPSHLEAALFVPVSKVPRILRCFSVNPTRFGRRPCFGFLAGCRKDEVELNKVEAARISEKLLMRYHVWWR